MEERLKNLKKSMDKTTYAELNFTEQHRNAIQEKVFKEVSEETIFQAAMQLLVHEKTGYELVNLLRGRGIRKYEESEGIVYTVLHQLEQDGYLNSSWNETDVKYYCLNKKGMKLLRKFEKQSTTKPFAFKELLKG